MCSFSRRWPLRLSAQERGEKAARELVEGVLRKTDESPAVDLGAWSRSVLERALGRARKNAPGTPTPLPAEDQSGRLAGRLSEPPRGPEIIVFMSLSVPGASLRQWSLEAARIGAPLVLRGVARGGLKATVKRVGAHLAEGAGAAIDPRLFRLFEVKAVPAVAVVPGGVPPCEEPGLFGGPRAAPRSCPGKHRPRRRTFDHRGGRRAGPRDGAASSRETQGRTPMNRNFWLRTITFSSSRILSITNALAEDPKAAARAMGNAGRSAAAAVARDPASASGVPGYAGTDRPERNLGADDLGNAAARALADPDDPGGRAGRAVIEGTTARPERRRSGRTIRYLCAARRYRAIPALRASAPRAWRRGP